MSEQEPQPRAQRSPAVQVEIGRLALVFTYENTYLIQFDNYYAPENEDDDYSHMNIIKHYDGVDIQNIYDSEELFRQLDELKFPKMRYPYPTDQHIEDYSGYLVADLLGEVDNGEGA